MRILVSDDAIDEAQRLGAKREYVALVATCYDRQVPLGRKMAALSLSSAAVDRLRSIVGGRTAERAGRLTLVVSFDDGVILSITKSKAYRAQQWGGRKGNRRFVARMLERAA